MAQVYVTGPALIYAGLANALGTSPVFVGTGESAPDIDIKAEFDPVMNDLGGTRVPFDRCFEGEEGMVSVVLNRFNWSAIRQMMSRPRFFTGTPGSNPSGDVGTLMGQEGMTFNLWLVWPFSTKAAMGGGAAANAMPSAVRFVSAFLLSPDKIQSGTKDQKLHLIWQCQRGFSVTAGGNGASITGSAGSFILYDYAAPTTTTIN